jgi:hypothetical protein
MVRNLFLIQYLKIFNWEREREREREREMALYGFCLHWSRDGKKTPTVEAKGGHNS